LLIPTKVGTDSDLIPVTRSDAMAVRFGAKRRWRFYGAWSDRDGSTGIRFQPYLFFSSCLRIGPAVGAVGMFYKRGCQEKCSPRDRRPRGILVASSPSPCVSSWSRPLFAASRRRVSGNYPLLTVAWWSNDSDVRPWVLLKPDKLSGWKIHNHSSIWDSRPTAFLGYPRGHRVGIETRCQST